MNRKNADTAHRTTVTTTACDEGRCDGCTNPICQHPCHRPGEDDVVPARASQAATAPNSPGDDAGAAHGAGKPAAGRTEPRMRPEDVPEEWHMLAVQANADRNHDNLCHCDAWPEQCVSGYTPDTWEHGDEADTIAAVIPAIRAAIADEIERIIGIDPPIDDQDQDIRNVVRHLRGLCTICGRTLDAEPCGHAHAINLRGDQ